MASPGGGGDSGRPDARVDNSELAAMAGMEQRLRTAMDEAINNRMEAMLGKVMSQISSMMRDARHGGGESGGDVGAPAGGGGDTAPAKSNQRSAAIGSAGGGGYVGGFSPQGETAASSGGGVGGGSVFSGGGVGDVLFSGGGGISKFAASQVSLPQLNKGAAQYPGWKQDFVVQAPMLGVDEVFFGEDRLPDIGELQATLFSEGYTHTAVQKTYYFAWNCLSSALTTDTDKAILRRCTNPREALQQLDAAYLPETQGAKQDLHRKFQLYQHPLKENPVEGLNKLVEMNSLTEADGVSEQFVFNRIIDALPLPQYEVTKQILESAKPLTRDFLVNQLSTRFTALSRQWDVEKEKRKGGEQAYIAGVSSGGGKKRQTGGGRGSKGHGRENGSLHDAGNRVDHRRCFRCHRRGHMKPDCTTKEEDYLEQCDSCSGFGHNSNQCATPAVVEEASLAEVLYEDEYDIVVNNLSKEPGWGKLTKEERERKMLETLNQAF